MRTLTYTVPPEAAGRRVKSILLYRLGIPASMIVAAPEKEHSRAIHEAKR